MAKAIQLSMWMVILGGLFLTTGFGGVPFVVMGMAVSFKLSVADQMRKLAPATATAEAAFRATAGRLSTAKIVASISADM